MIHPHTALRFISEKIGHGVVATTPIPCGTVTWVLDPLDRVFTDAEIAALPAALNFDRERHTFLGRGGQLIMPWDQARFVNHSCEPNCLATAEGFEIAVRDIAPGEEITNDYANLGMQSGESIGLCCCGAKNCRGLIVRADASVREFSWNIALRAALARAPFVTQPLRDLLPPAHWHLLDPGPVADTALRRTA